VKATFEEAVFRADANFGAGEEEDDGGEEQGPPCPAESSGELHAEHRGINGMANPAVGPGLNQFVILTQSRRVAPLLAEMTRGDPDQSNGGRSEDHRGYQGWHGFVKADGAHVGPYQRKADHDQQNAPLRGRGFGNFFAIGCLLTGFEEGHRPENPAENELGEGDPLQHGVDYRFRWGELSSSCVRG
jgi:hypothetical protein